MLSQIDNIFFNSKFQIQGSELKIQNTRVELKKIETRIQNHVPVQIQIHIYVPTRIQSQPQTKIENEKVEIELDFKSTFTSNPTPNSNLKFWVQNHIRFQFNSFCTQIDPTEQYKKHGNHAIANHQ